jgi:hypothetical protein
MMDVNALAEFDEFKDRDYADWKRVRSSIEHENGLVNHRLSWLFASQAFLYAAFAVVFNAWKNPGSGNTPPGSCQVLLAIISIVGVFVCVSIQRGLWEAEDQISSLDRWWYGTQAQREAIARRPADSWRDQRSQKDKYHPPLQGFIIYPSQYLARSLSYTSTPTAFMLAWSLIFVFVVLEYAPPKTAIDFLMQHGFQILSYVLVGIFMVSVWEGIKRVWRLRRGR